MLSGTSPLPQSRWPATQVRRAGAACLLPCLSGMALLNPPEMLQRQLPLAAGALVVLLIGATLYFRRTSAARGDIEQQLRRLGEAPSVGDLPIEPVRGNDPLAAGWNAILERVSGRAALDRLEQRLREAQSGTTGTQLSAVLNSLSDGIAVTDLQGTVTSANSVLGGMLGTNGNVTLKGQSILTLLSECCGPDSASIREKMGRSTRPVVIEARRGEHLADGVLRVARQPVLDGPANVTSYVWSIRDITQQKLADDMRNQFVYTATHELRTPLANIKAYAETLASHTDIDFEQQKQFYNTISAEATRLARFVDELLNVSQMESGALSLMRHETDMLRLIEEVVEHVQPEIRRKSIAFACQTPPKLPKLKVDKDKLTASMVNLLGNAVKYTPAEGQVRLEVEVDDRFMHLHVEDSGIGIADEERARIFDKFFRSSDDRVQEVNGSGLGLAFTQEVARLHGGCVAVTSELNKGSRFTMSVPLDQKTQS
ncbi:Sensor histidine kinase YycG [Maioricimonas rarisocia]|uniref:histidine kinase n=1 Tax=Maioricimonas rarisocia TaxID=2528026 RepID=A0A517ZCF1_9PLAN|nr:ATP-binding protein [Maioricimonas rarisocia]QDU40135.1 Sensor histidine kinase YycG [Maioricimonas rarisocia]